MLNVLGGGGWNQAIIMTKKGEGDEIYEDFNFSLFIHENPLVEATDRKALYLSLRGIIRNSYDITLNIF